MAWHSLISHIRDMFRPKLVAYKENKLMLERLCCCINRITIDDINKHSGRILLKFTQEMYLLVNVKPLDDVKVQNLWINKCSTSWSVSTRDLWWMKWLVVFNFCWCYFRFLIFMNHCNWRWTNVANRRLVRQEFTAFWGNVLPPSEQSRLRRRQSSN